MSPEVQELHPLAGGDEVGQFSDGTRTHGR
jgi:hypothetical protein